MIIKLPKNTHAGVINQHMARLIDLPPTMLRLAGLPPGADMNGQPLCDEDTPFANAPIAYSYAENDFEGNVQQAVRTPERALLMANEENPRGVPPVEFYDMTTDMKQQRNLADNEAFAEEIKELMGVIEQYMRMILENAPEPSADAEVDPQLQQQLEALGYM
jgi:arylsulfatase A-like enzyme